MQHTSRSDAQLFRNCVIPVHMSLGAITRLWLLNATGLMLLEAGGEMEGGEKGAHRRNNNDTNQSSVSINMFAGTKVKTIGAPTVRDFTNAVGSILAYKRDNQERCSNSNNINNRTLHTQGKVLGRVSEATFQIVFYTQQNHIFIIQQERSWLLQEILATDEKVFQDKMSCTVAKIYWRPE